MRLLPDLEGKPAADAEIVGERTDSKTVSAQYRLENPHTYRLAFTTVLAILALLGSAPPDPKPDLILAFNGSTQGEMVTCNCSKGLSGGYPRRGGYMEKLRKGGVPVLAIDTGNAFESASDRGKVKAEISFQALKTMGCDLSSVGELDVFLGIDFLLQHAKDNGVTLISATVAHADTQELIAAPYAVRSITAGSRTVRVGILGLCGTPPPSVLPTPDYKAVGVTIKPVEEAASKYIPELKAKCDFVVVVGQLTAAEINAIAAKYPEIAVIISGRRAVPPEPPITAANSIPVYYSTNWLKKATVCADVTLGAGASAPSIKLSENALGDDVADGAEMATLMKVYVGRLLTLPPQPEAIPNPSDPNYTGPATRYAGATRCGECHKSAYEAWQKTAHAKAIDSLATTNQTKDHDCLPCHTTGYLQPYGFRDVDLTPDRVNVQCEACHGPGSHHTMYPKEREKLKSRCVTCHNPERDPDFDFDRCWNLVKHGR